MDQGFLTTEELAALLAGYHVAPAYAEVARIYAVRHTPPPIPDVHPIRAARFRFLRWRSSGAVSAERTIR